MPDLTKEGKGWSGSGKLITGDDKTFQVQAVFPKASDFTVQFNMKQPTRDANTAVVCEALINWVVAGVPVSRRVTVGNGTTISGVASSINVTVEDNSIDLGGGGITPNEYTVDVTFAPGSRPSVNQPATLNHLDTATGIITVTPTNFTAIDIPQDAGVISVFVTVADISGSPAPIVGQSAQVSVDMSGIIIKAWDPLTNTGWVPIPAGATSLNVANNSAVVGQDMGFCVTWGIDG